MSSPADEGSVSRVYRDVRQLYLELDAAIRGHCAEPDTITCTFSHSHLLRWTCGERSVEVLPAIGVRLVARYWRRAEGAGDHPFIEQEWDMSSPALDVLGQAIGYFFSLEVPDDPDNQSNADIQVDVQVLLSFYLNCFDL